MYLYNSGFFSGTINLKSKPEVDLSTAWMNLRNNVTRGAVQINVNFPNRVNVYDYKVRVMTFNNDFNNISV
jgi:hypothetical protein